MQADLPSLAKKLLRIEGKIREVDGRLVVIFTVDRTSAESAIPLDSLETYLTHDHLSFPLVKEDAVVGTEMRSKEEDVVVNLLQVYILEVSSEYENCMHRSVLSSARVTSQMQRFSLRSFAHSFVRNITVQVRKRKKKTKEEEKRKRKRNRSISKIRRIHPTSTWRFDFFITICALLSHPYLSAIEWS